MRLYGIGQSHNTSSLFFTPVTYNFKTLYFIHLGNNPILQIDSYLFGKTFNASNVYQRCLISVFNIIDGWDF